MTLPTLSRISVKKCYRVNSILLSYTNIKRALSPIQLSRNWFSYKETKSKHLYICRKGMCAKVIERQQLDS